MKRCSIISFIYILFLRINEPKIQNKNTKVLHCCLICIRGRCTNYSWRASLGKHGLSKRRVYLRTYKEHIAESRSLKMTRKISLNDIWKWQHARELGYELWTLNTINPAFYSKFINSNIGTLITSLAKSCKIWTYVRSLRSLIKEGFCMVLQWRIQDRQNRGAV